LAGLGARIYKGHEPDHVSNAEVLVVSTAIDRSNVEIEAARELKIPIISRAEMLAELMRFRFGIAVAGTHGKTTTTSLVASVLAEAGLDPTFVIGGRLNSAGTNAQLGGGSFLVAEADESDASFLYLQPMMAVVTNIDRDHMETYSGDFDVLKKTFIDFLHHLPFYGMAVLCLEDEGVRQVLPSITKPYRTYGFSAEADVVASDLKQEGMKSVFSVKRRGIDRNLNIVLNLPGKHNVLNALAVISIATELGVADEKIQSALLNFKGIGRRFQLNGDVVLADARVTLVDDYGHHPREIEATLDSARQAYPDRRLVVVFQPHRFTRTRDLFEDFVQILSQADCLILSEVYAAGEKPISGADGRSLSRAVRMRGKIDPIFIEDISQLSALLAPILLDGDVVLTLGAGSIGQVAADLPGRLGDSA
jgi:UDP-N-acetylmuramate--alanine ligase